MQKVNIIWVVVSAVAMFLLMRSCEEKPKIVTKVKTETIIKTDTITKTVIKEVPKVVYVEKIKTVEGKEIIVYVDKETDTTVKANQFTTKLESNKATANLKITTTGELLDVFGTITYPETLKAVETIKTINASGFYIYGGSTLRNIQPEIGALFQIKNKIIIGAGMQYNSFKSSLDYKAIIGFRLF